jgi:hypothetical protein
MRRDGGEVVEQGRDSLAAAASFSTSRQAGGLWKIRSSIQEWISIYLR